MKLDELTIDADILIHNLKEFKKFIKMLSEVLERKKL
jgi:hypothetical protein